MLLELLALSCMVLSIIGAATRIWEWWPFAILAAMFFLAGNLHVLRSFSIGPSGIQAETREVPVDPPVDTKETWKERDRLELYVLANLSVGHEAGKLPIDTEPALSRFRNLKDAARDGKLHYEGDVPNVWATVRLEDFERYATETNIEALKSIAKEWRAVHQAGPDRASIASRDKDEIRLRLAHLRTAGVQLRNRKLSLEEVAEWQSDVRDWSQAVLAEIVKIDLADAEWFRTLDAVPPPRVICVQLSPHYSKTFRELDYMLVKLEQLLIRHSQGQSRNAK